MHMVYIMFLLLYIFIIVVHVYYLLTITFPGKVDVPAKVATLSIPSTGSVAHLELGALKAMGTHNYYNAAVAAFSVLGLNVGIDSNSINSDVGALHLLPHRMQVGECPTFHCFRIKIN